jgi:hypothetical protein
MSTDDVIRDARKTARDVQSAASDRFTEVQDDLIDYTQRKPLTALLSAFVIGVIVGKVVL